VNNYNIKTRAMEIPKYLQDFIDIFDNPLTREIIDLKEFEHIIKTIDTPLYSLLYNLLEPQLKAL
jgi:rRNA pseudouridine-1189 N-methylase Emg1 (Nep1/Mra1 family)